MSPSGLNCSDSESGDENFFFALQRAITQLESEDRFNGSGELSTAVGARKNVRVWESAISLLATENLAAPSYPKNLRSRQTRSARNTVDDVFRNATQPLTRALFGVQTGRAIARLFLVRQRIVLHTCCNTLGVIATVSLFAHVLAAIQVSGL